MGPSSRWSLNQATLSSVNCYSRRIASVDAMMEEFDFDTVVPGHGGVTDPEGLRTYRDNVVELRDRVSTLIRDGRSQEEIGEIIGMEYPSYSPGSLFMEWSLPGFMTELQ